MFKKVALVSSLVLSLTLAAPAFAQTSGNSCGFWKNLFGTCSSSQSANAIEGRGLGDLKEGRLASTTNPSTSTQIQCVGTAVAARESSLDTGMTTYTGSLNSAYSKRASDLASAYATTTIQGLRAGIKKAWMNFNASTRVAQKAWRTTKEGSWKIFRTAVKACGANESVSDSANAVTEMSGE